MNIKNFAFILLALGFGLALWFLFEGNYLHWDKVPNSDMSHEIQLFMTGLVAPLFSLAGTLLIFENLRNQNRQQFANVFFGMLNAHNKMVENMEDEVLGITSEMKPSKSRHFFDDICFRICIDYYKVAAKCKNEKGDITEIPVIDDISYSTKTRLDRLNAIYLYYFETYNSSLGHYFRHLFHIVKFIDRSNLKSAEKRIYVKYLRAQFSNYEILLLAYNGLSEYGRDFKPLINKYKLLKNLNREEKLSQIYYKRIVDPEIWADEYPHLKKLLNSD